MKLRMITFVLALLYLSASQAQLDIPEKKIKTTITEATVFLNGAQVLREGKTPISSGTTDIIIEKLPVRLDPTSIQVRGEGDFTIMAVTPRRVDPPKVEFVVDEDKIARLNEEKKELQIRLNHTAVQRQAFDEEEKLLNESRSKLSSYTEGGLSIEDVDKAAALYRRRFAELKEKQWQNGRQQSRLQQSIDSLGVVIAKLQTPVPIEQVQEKPTYEVKVTVSAKRAVSNAAFELSYLVAAAGWLPSYDIRVEDVTKPVYLGFRAQLYQATEEDWSNVKLSLSTGNPSRNSIKPEISPWYLDYYNNNRAGSTVSYPGVVQATGPYNAAVRRIRGTVVDGASGEPLIGATIIFQGTSVGTFTDVNGQYELAVPEGARAIEVKYIGYGTQALNVSSEMMNVRMGQEKALLEEVVITAMGSSVAGVTLTDANADYKKDIQLGKTLPLVVNRVERAANQLYEIERLYSIAGDERFAVDVMQYELPADYAYASAPKLDANLCRPCTRLGCLQPDGR
ncbi:MAG: mucoidy inhibitor MuiA family protein [Bacteroidia bacterium]